MTIEMTRTTITKTTTELNDSNEIETVADLPDEDRKVFIVSHERRTNRDCCHLMGCRSLERADGYVTTTPRDADDSTPSVGFACDISHGGRR